MIELQEKYNKLKEYLKSLGNAAVAFSSGVDSTFLLKTAKEVLGDNIIAITALSSLYPKRESDEAVIFCKKEGIKHIKIEFDALNLENVRSNPQNRCYFCKRELFSKIIEIANENGIENIVEGSNLDDEGDYRPGKQAISELGIKSPLKYARLTKNDIRLLSKDLNLSTYNKPSFACLASRFVYGEKITEDKLNMVDRAEQLLLNLGFKQFRVRIHGTIARIEVLENDFEKLINKDIRKIIVSELKNYGFTYISMDLQGYRTGSMNEVL